MDSLASIKHIIILMQENRSFDEYFGTLPGVRGFYDPSALPNVFAQQFPSGIVYPFRMDVSTTSAEAIPDNNHGWTGQQTAWNNGKMDQWGNPMSQTYLTSMGYYASADVPYQYALAQTFTICDAYFCSVLGPTTPNRLYFMSGTIDPAGTDISSTLNNPKTPAGQTNALPSTTGPLFTWTSYPEQLSAAGVDWAVYEEDPGDNFNFDLNLAAYFTGWQNALNQVAALNKTPGGGLRTGSQQFETDLKQGTLPTVSWIMPPASKSEHPSWAPAAGANYVAGKISALMQSAYWDDTVFILTYDENDGNFDHMVPPTAPPGTLNEWISPQQASAAGMPLGGPIGPGFRVPCIIISPWTVGGRVCQTQFDHTSILRFIYQVVSLAPGVVPSAVRPQNISTYRWTQLGDLTDAFDFSNHVAAADVPALPTAPPYVAPSPPLPLPMPPSPQVWPPVNKDCFFTLDRSSFGQSEVEAMLTPPASGPALFPSALFLVIDGFALSGLGFQTVAQAIAGAPLIVLDPPQPSITFQATGFSSDNPSFPPSPQRFTYTYAAQFADASAFGPPGTELPVNLTASIAGVSCLAQIDLISAVDPYILHGQTWYLSCDTRVFQIPANGLLAGLATQPQLTTPADAYDYISKVLSQLNNGQAPPSVFDDISTDETASQLELSQTVNNQYVFNFALARVRYLINALPTPAPAPDAPVWRVFFRLFRCMSSATNYDQETTYPVGGSGGVVAPLLGIVGGELATVPCFAQNRVPSLDMQADTANVMTWGQISPSPTVQEAYFGCWLDINQTTPLFPEFPASNNGPFPANQNLLPLQQLLANRHVCMVAEINYPPDPVPENASTAQSDKLAQRNLDLVPAENPGWPLAHLVSSVFDIRSTSARQTRLDELMFDWTALPPGSEATIYQPSLSAAAILQLASDLYVTNAFEMIDAFTLRCAAQGVVYLPVPPGSGNIAGLLSVQLPQNLQAGQSLNVLVRQITHVAVEDDTRIVRAVGSSPSDSWRLVLGAFQVGIPVTISQDMLPAEQRTLSVLRWIFSATPVNSRFYPVLQRYLGQIADRVTGLGGDPSQIYPSPKGNWCQPLPSAPTCHGHPEPHDVTGKVDALFYDRFGDFEAFRLVTNQGREHVFDRCNRHAERLVREAWERQFTLCVYFDLMEPRLAVNLELRQR
ncbi:phospholipase C [Paraburkholderia oxyphila]|uniref:phospholipase C n=1 Tax=Paraburkholderia oxyphila TaxID=614212 RepID=UPI00069487B2|nr:alkaline phosphatase family protein [Paraburkholderia oxyphila]